MTEITDQDRRAARQWAEDVYEMSKYDDETPRETSNAPDLAQTIAGMEWQYGVERTYLPGNETAVLWFPSEDNALQEIDNPNLRHCNPRLVRRLVGPTEPIDQETPND